MALHDTYLKQTAKIWDTSVLSYAESIDKINAHKRAERVLRHLASRVLGLDKYQYSIRSNMAGIASSGDVTLHTDALGLQGGSYGIYVAVAQSLAGTETVLYRACDHRADYVGYTNHWATFEDVLGSNVALGQFADTLCEITRCHYASRY